MHYDWDSDISTFNAEQIVGGLTASSTCIVRFEDPVSPALIPGLMLKVESIISLLLSVAVRYEEKA